MKFSRHHRDLEVLHCAQGEVGTNSKRPSQYVEGCTPYTFIKAKGTKLWDVDGNELIDFTGSLGAIVLGYSHPKVVEAVVSQAQRGTLFPLSSPLDGKVSEKVCQMFGVDRCRFLKNGDDATMAAIRVARASGLEEVYCEGYHGRSDLWTSLTPPASGVVDSFKIHTDQRDQEEISIVEPLALDLSPDRQEHLKVLREKSKCLIYDEIITGCRVPKLSVKKWWGIQPDILCIGKGMANGLPISCVAGRKELMDNPDYFISTTFSTECLSLAACLATLEELERKNMDDLWYYANRFQSRFNDLMKETGVYVTGYGTRGMLNTERHETALFMQEAIKAGMFWGRAFFYTFAHLEEQIEENVLNRCSDIAGRIRRGEVRLEGKAPSMSFKRER